MANWALVVGINQYVRLKSLTYAVSDAEAMVNYFWNEQNFEQIFYFSDDSPNFAAPDGSTIETKPTYANLWSFLDDFFADDKTPPLKAGDNFWFFFSGHGIRYEDRDYLMPCDASPRAIAKTAISVNYVTERLRRSGADNVILFLDACRNQSAKSGLGIGMEQHQGVITISSCSPKEESYEIEQLGQGSFTYVLLEALRIQGENNCATVERLYHHLRYRVPIINQEYQKPLQTPYVITDPASKLHLILLPKQATSADIALLKNDAWRAESQSNWELAKQLWIRVNIAAGGYDTDAYEAIVRLSQNQHQPSLTPSSETDKTGAKSEQNSKNYDFKIDTSQEKTNSKDLICRDLNLTIPGSSLRGMLRDEMERVGQVPLQSECGVDYTHLRDLLAAYKWTEADQETARKMLEVMGRTKAAGWLGIEDTDNFPCEDLRTIDRLWVHYSDGYFGFSVQARIYEELGGTREYNAEIWEAFGDRVGWREGKKWVWYNDIKEKAKAWEKEKRSGSKGGKMVGKNLLITGMLPLASVGSYRIDYLLFSRTKACGL